MVRPFVNNVENFIDNFIKSVNGKKLIDYLGFQPEYQNADYFFPNENILLELKCLEKDIFSDDDIERNESLIEKWFEDKTLNKIDIIPILLGRKVIPEKCYAEILKLARRTFQKIIEKANKQLKETKNRNGNIETKQVLLVCNDGNYFFENAQLFGLLCDILATRKELEIDCLVYFTVNQASYISDSNLDWGIWAPAYGNNANKDLHSFINTLGRNFNSYYNEQLKIEETEHREFEDLENGKKAIQEQTFIPKDIIYKK